MLRIPADVPLTDCVQLSFSLADVPTHILEQLPDIASKVRAEDRVNCSPVYGGFFSMNPNLSALFIATLPEFTNYWNL